MRIWRIHNQWAWLYGSRPIELTQDHAWCHTIADQRSPEQPGSEAQVDKHKPANGERLLGPQHSYRPSQLSASRVSPRLSICPEGSASYIQDRPMHDTLHGGYYLRLNIRGMKH